jgi:hypothetical protein
MAEMAILPSFTAEQKLLMKKALYYDFMLFNRHNKPFNRYLIKSGLINPMYTPPRNVARSVESDFNPYFDPYTSMIGINRYDKGLHDELSDLNRFIPDESVNLVRILEGLNNDVLVDKRVVFNPDTSEQIDQGIKALVANFNPGAPLYNCSTDAVMSAIMAGQFDQFLSDENKEDMKKICYSGANLVIPGPGIQGEEEKEVKLPQRMKPKFGGKKKCSKSRRKSGRKSGSKSRRKSGRKSGSKSLKGGGRVPAPYVGSIQGGFINRGGKQLFINPTGGIA